MTLGETLAVSVDTSAEIVQPSLEEEAAKYDTPAPEEERPGWLPEKFKSPEDLAKAYSELEKKLGSRNPKAEDEAPAAEDNAEAEAEAPEANEAEAQAREVAENAGLDFDALASKYWETGGLEDADYDMLQSKGIPKAMVEQFIAGQEALRARTEQEVFSSVGGEDTYKSMISWAGDNLSKDEQIAYNRAVNSGDPNMVMMAVKGLQARYTAEVGFEPSRSVTGENTKATATVYRSLAELQKDMADPRYAKDPAFRDDVVRKLERSDIM